MDKVRTEEEINTEIGSLTARGDELELKAKGEEGLSLEEADELTALAAKLKELGVERKVTESRLAMAKIKEELAKPTTPAPRYEPVIKRTAQSDPKEGIKQWVRSQFGRQLSPLELSKIQESGYSTSGNTITIPYDMSTLNKRMYRTKMNTGGAGVGLELTYKTYSQSIIEYRNYLSPFVSALTSESLANDGNSTRQYTTIDPTALKSTKTSASSGTEIAPTIPAKNFVTSKIDLRPFTLTAGKFTVTWEMANSSLVNVVDRIVPMVQGSDDIAIEEMVITDTGNGSNGGMKGLVTSATAFTPLSTTIPKIMDEYSFKIPKQYRQNAVMLVNDFTMGFLVSEYIDDVGRSLFDKNATANPEFDTLDGKPVYVSNFVDDYQVIYCVPEYFQLLFGAAADLAIQRDSSVWPDRLVEQVSMVTGAYIGPPNTCWKLDLGS
ncbi:phage major capsid protein [Limnoglobus roseus]|uniref:Phage major capsid protein n=1 Tax=Limnoglobus roseus TaxID=2598579 RepID=A0A5C1AAZ6_9BACT|nr:phage major capsid protein [Limnoglobus roseus]QEL16549.1 phage major capsid protein [Limnoglobus roseus]